MQVKDEDAECVLDLGPGETLDGKTCVRSIPALLRRYPQHLMGKVATLQASCCE